MAWLPLHQEIRVHPKTENLARELGVPIAAAVGHMSLLWLWCMSYAPDGNITRYNQRVIAAAAMWEGEPSVFVRAMVDSELMDEADGALVMHDWGDYGGKLVERRRADAKRKQGVKPAAPGAAKANAAEAGAAALEAAMPEAATPEAGCAPLEGADVPAEFPRNGAGIRTDSDGNFRREEKKREEKSTNEEESAREPFDIDNPEDPHYHSAHYKALLQACGLTEAGLAMDVRRRARVAALAKAISRTHTVEQLHEARRRWPHRSPPTERHFASEIDRLLAVNEKVNNARIRSPDGGRAQSRGAERDREDAEIDRRLFAGAQAFIET